jgi:hypothetical protein
LVKWSENWLNIGKECYFFSRKKLHEVGKKLQKPKKSPTHRRVPFRNFFPTPPVEKCYLNLG